MLSPSGDNSGRYVAWDWWRGVMYIALAFLSFPLLSPRRLLSNTSDHHPPSLHLAGACISFVQCERDWIECADSGLGSGSRDENIGR